MSGGFFPFAPAWDGASPAPPESLPKRRPRRRPLRSDRHPLYRVATVLVVAAISVLGYHSFNLTSRSEVLFVVGWMALTLVAVGDGVWRTLGDRDRRRRFEEHPGEPWWTDHTWNPDGDSNRAHRNYRSALPVVFVAAVYWLGPRWAVASSFRLFLDVFAALAVGIALVRSHRRAGVGDAHVVYDRFPFFTGETVKLSFGVGNSGATFSNVQFTLRCIDEVRRDIRVIHAETYQPTEDQALPGPDTFTELSFTIPDGAWSTWLWQDEPVYWELEVDGETTSGRYRDWFLIPIYGRPIRKEVPPPKR